MNYSYNNQTFRPRIPIRGCITGFIILVLLASGLIFLITRVHGGVTVSVGDHPTIIADSCTGSIFIQAGAEKQVTAGGIFPQYTQDSAENSIEFTECDAGLTLTVPPEADIQLDVADEVTIVGVRGIFKVSTNGSRIILDNVILEGKSKIDDNGGPIIFNGSLAQGSTPVISDNSGSIDATLPGNSSFNLNFTGILGPIVSDFPGVQNSSATTNELHLKIGNGPPTALLTLDLNDTSVLLNKGAS